MKHRIEISSVAEAEADSVFLRLSQVTSPVKASQQFAYSTFAMHHSKRLVKTRKKSVLLNGSFYVYRNSLSIRYSQL